MSRAPRSRRRRIVAALAFRVEHAQSSDELLSAVVEIVGGEVGLPYACVEFDADGPWRSRGATWGAPVGRPFGVPLTYQGVPVGRLVTSGRQPGQAVRRRDRRLLLDVARNTGALLHTARLLTELRESLDRVLYAREDERRRLRHELHDSLGPILAGISLGLHAARRIAPREPQEADRLIGHLEQELQSAIGEVRRLFETLRPPALDQLGLVAAIREYIDTLATRMRADGDTGTVSFDLQQQGDFTVLPAIVEVAAYRIVCEALTNVARHSRAGSCRVELRRLPRSGGPAGIRVEVTDDGVGMRGGVGRGLGLGSMRERAADLGGTFVIETPPDGGTRVVATLPIHPAPVAV